MHFDSESLPEVIDTYCPFSVLKNYEIALNDIIRLYIFYLKIKFDLSKPRNFGETIIVLIHIYVFPLVCLIISAAEQAL